MELHTYMILSTFLALRSPTLNFLNLLNSRVLLLINHFPIIKKRVYCLNKNIEIRNDNFTQQKDIAFKVARRA